MKSATIKIKTNYILNDKFSNNHVLVLVVEKCIKSHLITNIIKYKAFLSLQFYYVFLFFGNLSVKKKSLIIHCCQFQDFLWKGASWYPGLYKPLFEQGTPHNETSRINARIPDADCCAQWCMCSCYFSYQARDVLASTFLRLNIPTTNQSPRWLYPTQELEYKTTPPPFPSQTKFWPRPEAASDMSYSFPLLNLPPIVIFYSSRTVHPLYPHLTQCSHMSLEKSVKKRYVQKNGHFRKRNRRGKMK